MSTWKLTVINCGKQVDLPLTAFQHGSVDEHIYANKCISAIEPFYANITPLTSARSDLHSFVNAPGSKEERAMSVVLP